MKFLFVILLTFGAIPDAGSNTSREHEVLTSNLFAPYGTENYFFYGSTELEIAESFTTSLCKWGGSKCYVECTSVNLTTNIRSLNNLRNLQQIDTITGLNKTQLVFEMSEIKTTCNITKCESDEMNAFIPNMDVITITRVQKMCNISFASNTYNRAEKKYILKLINLTFDGATKTYEQENFKMTVVKMDMMMMNTTDDGHVKIPAPKLSDEDPSVDVFIPTEPFLNVSKEQRKIGLVAYNSAQQFITNSSTVLESEVIRIETAGRNLKNLANPLVINFPVNSEIILGNHTLSCQFYDEKVHRWDDMGSFTNLENFNSSSTVTCSYNHMTPFAVLLVDMTVTQIPHEQWKILSYVSYIGSGLSLFFSVLTILFYIKSSKRDNSIRIHVSLSAAVFLLNTSFLFIEWGATWSQESLCVLIAVIIQYSLLSCFSWMAIEAMHLYLLLVKVFNTYIKHYMIKLSLFGWGVPAVLVGGSLCVFDSYPFYGPTEIKWSNMSKTMRFCWITDIRFLYGMNVSYFSLTFLFNVCVLVAVTRQIFKLQYTNIRGSKLPTCKDVCTVLGLTLLLGMTWGLAFFTSGYTNYPILYLFCICNTLQGLFLFLWFYGTIKKHRRLIAQSSTMSERSSPSVKTYESSFSY